MKIFNALRERNEIILKVKRILSMALALSIISAACVAGVASASEMEPQVEWHIPHSIKIGEGLKNPATGRNLPVKGHMNEYNYWESDYFARVTPWDDTNNDLFPGNGYYSNHAGGPSEVMRDGTAQITTGDYQQVYPFRPCTVTYQFQVFEYGEEPGQEKIIAEVGEPYTVTVEEPVVQTNAPAYVQTGSTIDLITELTNTALGNEKVAPYLDKENYMIYEKDDGTLGWMYNDEGHVPAFAPSVEILEGADLVQRTESDYSNTLSSSEKLAFTGTGTVKLKVTYRQLLKCTEVGSHLNNNGIKAEEFDPLMDFEGAYSPEKIITIHVTEDGNAPEGEEVSDSSEAPTGEDTTEGNREDDSSAPIDAESGASPNTGDGSFVLSIGALAVSGIAVPVLLTWKKKHP